MLLTSQYKPKGLFGGHAPSGANMTPQIDPAQLMQRNMDLGSVQQAMQRNMALGSVQQAMQPKKPGINWLGVLADALAGAAGREGPYAASMMAQRQQQQQAELAQQQRIQGLQDWQWKKQWERDNPAPINNDTINDFNWYKSLSPEDQAIYDRLHPITIMGPDGPYAVPRSALGGQQQADDEWGAPVDSLPGGVGGNTGGMFPVAKSTGFDSYQSGSYDPLEAAAGKEYGVPPAILQRLRVKGEKSNANQVSEVGARSVYQITPETRAGIMKLYGFDPWSSPANAARGAAIVARDMYRKFGNWNDAMTGYHGGNDTRNWGPRTRAYSKRTKM